MMLNLVGKLMVFRGFRKIKSMNYILVSKGTEKENRPKLQS